MVNKLKLKKNIIKFVIIYSIFCILPISLFITTFVFPQVPMMTLGYAYDGDFFSGGKSIGDIDIRSSNQSIYLSYLDGMGIHAYRSDDDGFHWIDLLNNIDKLGSIYLDMDMYNDTIGLTYNNRFYYDFFFIYSEDRGLTWSTPHEVPFNLYEFAFINSTYLITYSNNYTSENQNYNSTIYLSRDLGLNWEIRSIIPDYLNFGYTFTIRVSQNHTIYMFGRSTMDIEKNSIYRSADLGKTWTEIETSFTGGRLIMGADNEFYVYSNLGNIYKSTDECQTWSHVEVTEVNRNDISSPVIDINEDGEIFVVYTKEILRFEFHMYDYYGLDYFWVGRDIWTGRYVSYFFAFFMPATGIGFLILLTGYGLYTLIKWDNARYKAKIRRSMQSNSEADSK